MLKILGIVVIVLGVCGFICGWKETKKTRLINLHYMIKIITEAEFILIRERKSIIFLFEYMGKEKNAMSIICKEMAVLLKEHAYKNGLQAWENAVRENHEGLCLSKEQETIICMAGEALFKKTAAQMEESLVTNKLRLQKIIENEEQRISEQNRLVIPLCAFGGILLIIIFL